MRLSVVIVNYNAREHLEKCLTSLFAHTRERPMEVIVVDNASTDGSTEMLRRAFPEVECIASAENLGFARANNLALRRTKGRFVLLLNNDTIVTPGAVDGLLEKMEADPRLGVLGPLLRNEDGSVQISYGRMIGFRTELVQKFLSERYDAGNRWFRRYVERRALRPARPDWVSGACLMLRAEVLPRAGLFDEQFFMYTEEVDLCQRIRREGFHVLYTPDVEIVHLRGKSTETNREKAILEYRRSQLYFYRKHYGAARVRLLKAYLLAKIGLAWLVEGRGRRPLQRELLRLVWNF